MSAKQTGATASKGIPLPKISSAALAKAISDLAPVAQAHTEVLDRISADIQGVENFLGASGYSKPFSMCLDDIVKHLTFIDKDSLHAYKSEIRAYLTWGCPSTASRFRLIYEEFDSLEDTVMCRPLIECSAGLRLAVYSYLPTFVSILAPYMLSEAERISKLK